MANINNTNNNNKHNNNKERPWRSRDNRLFMDKIDMCNRELAEIMGRTYSAIELNRARMAAKLYVKDESLLIEDCCSRMHSDMRQTRKFIKGKLFRSVERQRMAANEEMHRRREEENAEDYDDDDDDNNNNELEEEEAEEEEPLPLMVTASKKAAAIQKVIDCIDINHGETAFVWENKELVPSMIEHFSGFNAYAQYVAQKKLQ